MPEGILLMLSGGIDSTAILHSLLTEEKYQEYDIYVHHISLDNRQRRSPAEAEAVEKIVTYYRYVNHFDYTVSSIDTLSMNARWSGRFSFDMDIVCFMAAQVCLAKRNIRQVMLGVMADDFIKAETREGAALRYREAPNIFQAALYYYPEGKPRPQVVYPAKNLTKKQLWDTLPEDVQKLTWSCRNPVWETSTPTTCGVCEPCKSIAGFEDK